MLTTTSYEFGDLVLVPFPFTDQTTTKQRLQLGMPVADYEAEVQRFRRELGAYNAGLTQDSRARTDEVGHARSEVASRGCYVHHVP